MNKIDINLFTEQIDKCYTILNQQVIIIDNVKLLMNNYNTLDSDYESNKEEVTTKLTDIESTLATLRLDISSLRRDITEVENNLPSNITESVLTLKEGSTEYTINATENDGLYIYSGREELVHLYDGKAYINNIVSPFTMPPSIKFDAFNSYVSGEFETKLTPIPIGETLTLELTESTDPVNRVAFDWSSLGGPSYENSVKYLCNQTISVVVKMPTSYGGGTTLTGYGKQISNNIFPSMANPFGSKIGATYLVNVFKGGQTYPQSSDFLTLIVFLGIVDDYKDRLAYQVLNTINVTGFIDYH